MSLGRAGTWRRRHVALVFVAALLLGCGSDQNGDAMASNGGGKRPAVPVTVATVVREDVPRKLRAIGNVEAYSTVSIRSRVEGQLAEVHFREGQEVRKDELLFVIDPRPFQAALRKAEADLARDVAERDNAQKEAERRAKLLDQGIISLDEHDQAQTRAAALRATAKADEAALENAKLQLQYCYVRSPIDGRLGQLLVHEGNVVKENDTVLAVVNQIRPVYVAFSVPEAELAGIRERAARETLEVQVGTPGSERPPATGKLSFIDNRVDTKTGTVLLKGLFPNDDEALWPGQFVDVALVLAIDRQVVVAPARAVQTGQDGEYVFVVKPDMTVETRPVTVGRSDGSRVLIEKGLEAGDRVVTDGQLRLAAGLEVQIRQGVGNPPASNDPS
jgi:multidrug efflux system membrane fusion protein